MNFQASLSEKHLASPAFRPFALYLEHVRPALEEWRPELEAMYASVMGRPELDPVFLLGVTLFQAMERLPDRRAAESCLFDMRWRTALGVPDNWKGFNPTSLVYFRHRLCEHRLDQVALKAGLEAMARAGVYKAGRAVRIDSTHVLGDIALMSRLDCVRETLRLALEFLAVWSGPELWEPWWSRYVKADPQETRTEDASKRQALMVEAGRDMREVLERVKCLGEGGEQADPIRLLQRVFEEQFEVGADGGLASCQSSPPGAVHSPHDPEAQWSTKRSLGKKGWVGYKVQVCETVPETVCKKGEPTTALITAVVAQEAITGDHGSIEPTLEQHCENTGEGLPPTVFADAGYVSAPALERAENQGYELCGPMAPAPTYNGRLNSEDFEVDLPARSATCPAGKSSVQCARIQESAEKSAYYYFTWSPSDCGACPMAERCLSKRRKEPGRTLQVTEGHMHIQERRKLGKTHEYRVRMRARNGVEGSISELKRGYCVRRCRYRGILKTQLHMIFSAGACNLRRWAARICWTEKQPC